MMTSDLTRKALNVGLAVLALLALFRVPAQAGAHEEVSFVFHTIPWGMVRGQTSRFSVFNPNPPSERQQPISIQVTLLDASGAVIATSDEIAIPAGEFRSVDFSRAALPLSDKPGERLQTSAQIRYRTFSIVDRTQILIVMESIDDVTGATSLLFSQKPKEIVVVGTHLQSNAAAVTDLSIIVYANRGLIGLSRGQTLRVNALNHGEAGDPQRQPARAVRARVSLYDANNALLSRSDEASIAPGEFNSFDFDRADITASGERAGGRLQVRVSLEAAATDPSSLTQSPSATAPLASSLELIDNSTGRTTAVWVTVGFFETVPPRNAQ